MPVDKGHPEAGFVELEPLVIPALDLTLVILGFVVVLFFAAGWVILQVIDKAFSYLKFSVGPFTFQFPNPVSPLNSLFQRAMYATWSLVEQHAVHFGRAAWSFIMMLWRFTYVVGDTMLQLSLRITGVSQSSQDGLAQLRAKEQADVNTIDAYVANAQAEIDNNRVFAQTYTDERIANLQALENTRIAAEATARANAVAAGVNQAEAFSHAEATTVLERAGTLFNQAEAHTNAVETQLEQRIQNATVGLEDLAARDLTTAESFATGAIASATPTIIAKAVEQLAPRLSKLETETAECLDPLCDTVTPQAKRLGQQAKNWQNLEELGLAALLIALAAECLTDPGAVASDVHTVVNDAGEPILTGFRDLIGA